MGKRDEKRSAARSHLGRILLGAAVAVVFFVFALTAATARTYRGGASAVVSAKQSTLRVCVQRKGPRENRGDLNVLRGACRGGRQYAIPLGKPAKGAPGPAGSPGPSGAQGVQGTRGATGVTGRPGVTGTQGTHGVTGATGARGATGAQGLAGARGPTGAKRFG